MSGNPFKIVGPAIVSFSGGRTSGMMLKQIIDAHGGILPADVIAVFTNTGKELPETLDFIDECSRRWGVEIVWLERRSRGRIERVTHVTASRAGEPFDDLIVDKKYLPNPTQRICTQYLKIDLVRRWVRSALAWDHWLSVIGFRADEPRRKGGQSPRWDVVAPLRDAGVAKADVTTFWGEQPFNLGLEPWESNCDLCFLKGHKKRERVIRDRPSTPQWWIAKEHAVTDRTSGKARTFRSSGPSYAQIAERARLPMLPIITDPIDDIDDLGDCTCMEGV